MSEDKKIIVETDFKENFKIPLKRFVFIYPVFIIAMIIAGKFYVQNIDYMSDNSAKYKDIIVAEAQEDDFQTKPAIMLAGVDVKNYLTSTDDLISKGSISFATNCASCHGEKGMGNGIAGAGLNPKPRNFHSQDGWTNGTKINEMYKTLEEGIIKNGMNSYSQLPIEERFALIYYIRSLASGYPDVKEDELSDLDLTYSLSAGKQSNNQISIEKSISLLTKENAESNFKLTNIVTNLENKKDVAGYDIFQKTIDDKVRFLKILNTNQTWRDNQDNFVKIINSTLLTNGVNVGFNKLNSIDISNLHNFVKTII